MSSSTSIKSMFQIPAFDGSREKWPIWKQRVKACMVARGWWTVVEKPGNSGAASIAPSKEEKEEEISKIAEKRIFALGALTLALPDDLMSAYVSEDVTDPSEVWEKLCSHFESHSMMNKSHLRNKLSALRMNGSTTYLMYYTELMMVVRSLKGMKEPMSDAEIAHYLLNGFVASILPGQAEPSNGKGCIIGSDTPDAHRACRATPDGWRIGR